MRNKMDLTCQRLSWFIFCILLQLMTTCTTKKSASAEEPLNNQISNADEGKTRPDAQGIDPDSLKLGAYFLQAKIAGDALPDPSHKDFTIEPMDQQQCNFAAIGSKRVFNWEFSRDKSQGGGRLEILLETNSMPTATSSWGIDSHSNSSVQALLGLSGGPSWAFKRWSSQYDDSKCSLNIVKAISPSGEAIVDENYQGLFQIFGVIDCRLKRNDSNLTLNFTANLGCTGSSAANATKGTAWFTDDQQRIWSYQGKAVPAMAQHICQTDRFRGQLLHVEELKSGVKKLVTSDIWADEQMAVTAGPIWVGTDGGLRLARVTQDSIETLPQADAEGHIFCLRQ